MDSTDISKNTKFRRQNILSLEDKIRLLNHYKETKCSIRKLAQHFNIGKTQAGLIIKKEQLLYEQWHSGSAVLARKRLTNEGFEIDKKMYDWYLAKKQDNQIINGVALQNKALELARDLGYESFRASNGWLAKFVKRHGISFKEDKNECRSKSKKRQTANNLNTNLDEWSKILSSVIDKYPEGDIFSAVQTGLFFSTTPDEASYFLEKTCASGTLSKERLTILFCASMDGRKEKPLVIADIPEKVIENLKLTEVDCKSNSFVWLTKSIMNDWLTNLNNRMAEQKRNIVLFLDHSLPCHDCQLSNIRTIYFPNRVSSSNQRINWGIIQNFKIVYRLRLLKHLIALKDKDLKNSLLDLDHVIDGPKALTWISFSWTELSPNIIRKCFEEIFFNVTPDDICDEMSATLNDVSDLLCACDSFMNAADYVSIDDYLITESVEILVDADIYANSEEENCNKSKNVEPNNDVSNFYSESLSSLQQLEQFYLSHNDSKGASLVKQLISHHENVINDKNIHNQS